MLLLSFLVCALIGRGYAQNCGIVGVDGNTVNLGVAPETTADQTTIWVQDTYNVTGAAALAHPHTRYLIGLRYTARYEYRASDVFHEFIDTEWSTQLIRNVIFNCADGSTRIYYFTLNVTDVNNKGPVFNDASYTATISKSDNSTEPYNANIYVSDSDYELANADLLIRSTNRNITPFVDPTWIEQHPNPYTYRIDFLVNKGQIEVGNYDVVITADDGVHNAFTVLSLRITE